MIHPNRTHLVRTRELLAQDMKVPMGTFRSKKPYTAKAFPAPISSDGARVLLWDGEQTDAYLAGEPVPALPPTDDIDVLLDRQEAAATLKVTPRTWDGYKTAPQLTQQRVDVCGVEHWPRSTVLAFRDARPGKAGATGRPKGRTNAVPHNELHPMVAALLDASPAITIAEVRSTLRVAPATAQRALAQIRGERIAALMKKGLTFDQAADRLRYPPSVRRGARDVAAVINEETEA
ncbi:hypothetical protein [Streptomyces noursei]